MFKKVIGLLASVVLALSSGAAVFADSNTAASDTYNADDSQTTELDDNYSDDSDDIGDINAETPDNGYDGDIVEYALENEDPGYGKYLESLEQAQQPKQQMLGAARTIGYTNNSLIHNPRFANADKVWGIDVSYFQYDIDWEKVKAAGIDFAIIRVGYRGYGTGGQLVLDYKFNTYIEEALDAGLEIGVYFYTQAISPAEAREEADFVYKYIKDYDIDLPVYFDIESVDFDTGRLDSANLNKTQKTALVTSFCDRMEQYGYTSGVYANMNWLTYEIDGDALGEKYPVWLAHYTTQTNYSGEYNTWQFTGSGRIDGINTAVDIDVDYRDGNRVGDIRNFSLNANESGSAELTWDKVYGAEKYEVFRYNSNTKAYTRLASTAANSYTVTLLQGNNYAYCVRAVKTHEGKTVYGNYSELIYASKNQVSGITCKTDTNSVTLTWQAVSGAGHYEIYRSSSINGTYTKYSTVSSTEFKNTGLKSAAFYSYKVRPVFGSGSSATYGVMSNAADAVTKPEKASVPKHNSSTSNSVNVSWNAVSGANGYQVGIYNSSTKSYTVKTTVSSGTRSYNITGLSSASSYRVSVRAYVEYNGIREYGAYASYKTCGTAPDAPTEVYATVTPTSLSLKWNAVNGADSYTVYRKTGNTYNSVGTTSATSISVSRPTGSGNATYCAKANVVINKKTLTSGYSNESTFGCSVPATPGFSSRSVSATSMKLTWKKDSSATGYRLYRYDPAKNTYVTVKTLSGASKNSYTVTGLSPKTQYRFKVKTFKKSTSSISWSKASAIYYATTAAVNAPVFSSAVAGRSSINLTWKKDPLASGYRLYRYDQAKDTYVTVKTISGANNNSYTVTGLAPSVQYRFKVKTYIKSDGQTLWSKASEIRYASTMA